MISVLPGGQKREETLKVSLIVRNFLLSVIIFAVATSLLPMLESLRMLILTSSCVLGPTFSKFSEEGVKR